MTIVKNYALQKFGSLIDFRKNSEKSKLEIGFFSFIVGKLKNFLRMRVSSKQKLAIRAEHQYVKEMDVVNILTRLHEIEKIKKIIFTEKQLSLFTYLSKPMIPKPRKADIQKERETVLQDFEELKNDSVNNLINANLIKLLDQNLKEYKRDGSENVSPMKGFQSS